jgi:hypothetical protein
MGNWLIAGALSAVFTVASVGWLDSVEESLLVSAAGADAYPGIEKVDVEFGKRTILLNVYLSKPLNCTQVITALGIESLPVKDRIYVPTCSEVNNRYIRIIYTESITV